MRLPTPSTLVRSLLARCALGAARSAPALASAALSLVEAAAVECSRSRSCCEEKVGTAGAAGLAPLNAAELLVQEPSLDARCIFSTALSSLRGAAKAA